jgi:hypothetical protein
VENKTDKPEPVSVAKDSAGEAWYIVPELDPEPKIAQHWIRLFGKGISKDNLVTVLPLDRLHARSSVYVLCRKPTEGEHGVGLKPIQPIIGETDGARIHRTVSLEELAADMDAHGPIRVREHWVAGQTQFDARLNRSTFMAALGSLCTPWAPAWKDMTRKDGDYPTMLYLRFA